MTRELIGQVVLDQWEKITKRDIGIPREINLDRLLNNDRIIAISGVRRSGKTTLLLQILRKLGGGYYLSFDDERLNSFELSDFQTLMEFFLSQKKSRYVFFDEIQNIAGWERFIRRLFDEGYKVFITGSNAKLLSSELATHLTGRYFKVELFPFSFREMLDFYSIEWRKNIFTTEQKAAILEKFDQYLENGGFPEFLKYNDNEVLKRIYEDILYKDLALRYNVRNVKALKELALYLLTNFTSQISYKSLAQILKIKSHTTVQEYISILQEAYLFFELYKYDFSLKQQFTSQRKIYAIDNGLRNNIAFRFSSDRGKLLENAVFLELKRRGKELYFYKSQNQHEIDFVFYENGQIHCIQVAFSFENPKTLERELNAFYYASQQLPHCNPLIITYDVDDKLTYKNMTIQLKPMWNWALEVYS